MKSKNIKWLIIQNIKSKVVHLWNPVNGRDIIIDNSKYLPIGTIGYYSPKIAKYSNGSVILNREIKFKIILQINT